MRKSFVLFLVVSLLVFSLCACSSNGSPSDAVTAEPQPEQTVPAGSNEPLSVTFEPRHDEAFANDGTLVFTSDVTVPTFTGGCADAVTLDFSEILDQVDNECMDIRSAADETYAEWDGGEFPVYHDDMSIFVARNDEKVLSLCCDSFVFMGMGNGTSLAQGVNYSVETGERLTLDDICGDAEQLVELLFERAAQEIGNGEYTLNDDWLDTLRESLDYGGNWYFDDDGLVLIFGEYEFTEHSDGIISVSIPYAEIKDHISDYCPA